MSCITIHGVTYIAVLFSLLLPNHGLAIEFTEALKWLPANSETVIVANNPFPLSDNDDEIEDPVPEVLRQVICHVIPEKLRSQLVGQKVKSAILAGRHFGPPQLGLGSMESESVLVLEFENTAHTVLNTVANAYIQAADESYPKGTNVGIVHRTEGDRKWTECVAFTSDNLLVCANNEVMLRQLLTRMEEEFAIRAFPDDLPEWQFVDRNASIWVMRHYRGDYAELDPSSPLRPKSAANVPDFKAVGLVFVYKEGAHKVATCHYLTGAATGTEVFKDQWSSIKLIDSIAKVESPGVFGFSINADELKYTGVTDFLYVLIAYIGYGDFV